jgi:Kdo2-lipid IVA lauroyltransferase/acyltransferase
MVDGKALRQRAEYTLVRAVMALAGLMPDPLVRGCGRALGLLFCGLDRKHRRVARRNVAAAFPTRSAAEHRAIVRGAFQHFGILLFELLKFGTMSPAQVMARLDFEGDDRVRLAYAQKRGVMFVTGHFGFWELNGIGHALQFEPIGVLARALDNPWLNTMLEELRQRTGNSVIYRQGTIRRVMRLLQEGRGVAVLIDQHTMSRDAIYVDFFDRPAATTSVVAALALRTGAAVVPTFSLPLGGGRYRIVYEHPIEPPEATSENAIRDFTQRCTDVLEMYVRRHPELWLWMHRRWRDSDQNSNGAPALVPASGRENERAEET